MREINNNQLIINPINFKNIDESLNLSDDFIIEKLKANKNNFYRPHVLWFDECYDEELYKYNSSLKIA